MYAIRSYYGLQDRASRALFGLDSRTVSGPRITSYNVCYTKLLRVIAGALQIDRGAVSDDLATITRVSDALPNVDGVCVMVKDVPNATLHGSYNFV